MPSPAPPSCSLLLFATTMGACRPAQLTPCQEGLQGFGSGAGTRMIEIEEGDLRFQAQLVLPIDGVRYPEGAPVTVFVHGTWADSHVPLEPDSIQLSSGYGIAALYLNLPGSDSDDTSTSDRRGARSRATIATALRYAAGLMPDLGECTLDERIAGGLAPVRVLSAYSNGGNLAWATLADPTLDLPEIAGITTFETPASSQMATVELGTVDRGSPIYREGSCGLDAEGGISCELDYGVLGFDREASPQAGGTLYADLDSDGTYSESGDFPLGMVWSPADQLSIQSTPATEEAWAQGLSPGTRADPEAAASFWAVREAPRAMAAAVGRFPDLAAIESGTEVDHVLSGPTDHPNVSGMLAAMQASGVRWTRMNADLSYLEATTGQSGAFSELPANTPIETGQSGLPYLPEDENIHDNAALTAAVLELMDRAYLESWGEDLDGILQP